MEDKLGMCCRIALGQSLRQSYGSIKRLPQRGEGGEGVGNYRKCWGNCRRLPSRIGVGYHSSLQLEGGELPASQHACADTGRLLLLARAAVEPYYNGHRREQKVHAWHCLPIRH